MANTVNTTNTTKVVTGKVRFSFVNILEARAFGEGQTPKYSVMLLIPKTDVGTVTRMKAAIDAAAQKVSILSLVASSLQSLRAH